MSRRITGRRRSGTKRLADQGVAEAQYNLGNYYYFGKGIPPDPAQGQTWYRKAADQGVAEAQYNLGLAYERGRGVPQDYTEAAKWYRKAAGQGIRKPRPCSEMRTCSVKAYLGTMPEAVIWLGKAAEQGLTNAQYNLGVAYADGQGIPQDSVQSYSGSAWRHRGVPGRTKRNTRTQGTGREKLTPKNSGKPRMTREWAKSHPFEVTDVPITVSGRIVRPSIYPVEANG